MYAIYLKQICDYKPPATKAYQKILAPDLGLDPRVDKMLIIQTSTRFKRLC